MLWDVNDMASKCFGGIGGVIEGSEVLGDDCVWYYGYHEGIEGGTEDGILFAG